MEASSEEEHSADRKAYRRKNTNSKTYKKAATLEIECPLIDQNEKRPSMSPKVKAIIFINLYCILDTADNINVKIAMVKHV